MFVRLRKCARMGCSSASHLYLQSARETHIFNSTKIVMDFVFICSYSSFYPPSFLLISFYTSLACFLYVSRSFLLSTSSVSLTLVAFVCLSFLLSISLSLALSLPPPPLYLSPSFSHFPYICSWPHLSISWSCPLTGLLLVRPIKIIIISTIISSLVCSCRFIVFSLCSIKSMYGG